jgi:hypothetical protein
MCIDDMLERGKLRHIQGYKWQHTPFFADEQIILHIHILKTITVLRYVLIWRKPVVFRGKFHIRTNIVTDNEPFEQASRFTYVVAPHTTLIKKLRWDVISTLMWHINHLTPNGHFSGRTAPLTYRDCIFLFIQQIYLLNILNMLHTLRFFLFKLSFIS